MSNKIIKTTCKVGACEPQCGLCIKVENGVMTSVVPDKAHPISKGYICTKGKQIPEYQNDPDRLLHPIKRTANGWEQIEWSTATTEVGKKLRAIFDQYGSGAISTYWGNAADTTGMVVANSLCSAFGSANSFNVLSLEYTDRGAVAEKVLGDQTLILQPDADHTEFALLLGTNPMVTQGMTLLQRRPRVGGDLKDISRRGGKVVVVDPRVTETVRIADQHIMIKPGTDLYLLLGMIHVIFKQDLANKDFVSRYTTGCDQWMASLKDYDLTWAADITGIAVDIMVQLTEEFCAADSAFVTTRVGVQTSHNTTLTEWAVMTLNAISGNIDRLGGVYFHGGAIDNTKLIHKFTKGKNPAASRIGKYPQIFGGPPATVFADDVLSDDPDRIRALIVVAGNPVISFPNTKKMEKALEKLDLLVCIDLYLSDTGSFADYNLPAATIYEKGGLHVLTQPFDPYPFAEWRKKVVQPRGAARPEWDMARDISRAAGIPFLNNPLINAIDRILGCFGKNFSEQHFAQYLFFSKMSGRKISLKSLKASDVGIKFADVKWGDFLKNGLKTENKKINLAPDDFMSGLKAALDRPPCPTGEFPFMLISGGRRLESFNTWTHNMPTLVNKLKGNHAIMNAEDGIRLGISDGMEIKITSKINSIIIRVELSEDIRSGVVVVHQFWGHNYESGQTLARKYPGVNVNMLHDDQVRDKYTGMPVFNGTPCSISPSSL
jgi:formate dehydrogenase